MADRFEIMKLSVPLALYHEDTRNSGIETSYVITKTPTDNEATAAVWEKASELAREGWELVGVIPLIAYTFPVTKSSLSDVRDLSHSYTSGYELLLSQNGYGGYQF